ncbi:hypothetical protein SDC9_157839 [bioreactor metagenome]|uniref:DUF3221 domain-containing protein n=1 Tax=bioreactor metagenome TaxID=1076179 RepID=A0A645FDH2_9ZZZZ
MPGLTERMNAQEDNIQNADENTTENETKTDSGTYTGRVDNNSIEIRISAIQDESKAFRVFALSDEIRENFDSYGLKTDDQVKFEYYEQDQGQPVLTKLEKIAG